MLFDTYNGICYGTGIAGTCYYGNPSQTDVMKYWVHNYFHNKKQFKIDKNLSTCVDTAMAHGCTMFDTSRAYARSEHILGNTLKKYDRESFQIVTKIKNGDQFDKNIKGGLETSLRELNMEYVDLCLLHWPVTDCYLDSWKELEKLYKKGLCKAIGVSNCNIHHLQEIEKIAEIMPMVNEFECHPLLTQKPLREYCNQNNIKVMAYTSTARNDERLRKTVLVPIAEKYNKNIIQVILRWHQQIGNIPIVSTSSVKHLINNTEIRDFTLTEEEIASIEAININSRLRYDPDNCDFHQL